MSFIKFLIKLLLFSFILNKTLFATININSEVCLSLNDAIQTFENKITFGANAQVIDNPDNTLPSSSIKKSGIVETCETSDCVKDTLVSEPANANIEPPVLPGNYNFGSDVKEIKSAGTYSYSDLKKLTIKPNISNITVKPADSSSLNINTIDLKSNSDISFSNSSSYSFTANTFTGASNNDIVMEKISTLKLNTLSINANSKFTLKADEININSFTYNANGDFKISPNSSSEVIARIKTLKFTANANVILAPGDYYIDKLQINANINLKTSSNNGTVRIFVNTLASSANFNINKNGNPSQFLIYANSDVSLGANGEIRAVIISKGKYTQKANTNLRGAVLAREVVIAANNLVRYDDSIGNIDLGDNYELCGVEPPALTEDDSLCYGDITHTGMMCFAFGPFYGGMNCGLGMTIKNIGDDILSNVVVSQAYSGFSGDFKATCKVDGVSSNCTINNSMSFSNASFSMFKKGIDYNLENMSPNDSHIIFNEALFSGGMNMSMKVIGTYNKGEDKYQVAIPPCPAPSAPERPVFSQCGMFPSALTTWEYIMTGSSANREVKETDTIYADSLINDNGKDATINCIFEESSNNCKVEEITLDKLKLPTFLESTEIETKNVSSGILSEYQYGNLNLSGSVKLKALTAYNASSVKLMKINSITISGDTTLTLGEGDYWIKDFHSTSNKLTLRVEGKVRLFIGNDMILDKNILDFNYDDANGQAKNLYIFVYGNFTTTSAGGGKDFKIVAYMYTKGTTTISSNTENHYFKGAFTSEKEILTTNNQKFEYDPSGLRDDGFGGCDVDYICQNPREFKQRISTNIKGDIELIGNSILCKNQNGVCGDPSTNNNNNINMMYIDYDGNDDTLNSSSAKLSLPDNSKILWAGLYWQGYLVAQDDAKKKASSFIKYAYTPMKETTIASYETTKAANHNWIYYDKDRWYYQGFVEITDFVKEKGNGWYWIADLVTTTGQPKGGSFGAWSIAVVYENYSKKLRNLTIFDGYISLANDGAAAENYLNSVKELCPPSITWAGVTANQDVNLSGFITPTEGEVSSTLFLFAGEGDINIGGDGLKLADKDNTLHSLFDNVNTKTNIFNSSISRNGSHLNASSLYPYNSINSCGIDIDTFNVSSIIENSQKSTRVNMNSTGDGYFPGVFGFATDLYEPRVCYNETFYDENATLELFDPITKKFNQNANLYVGDQIKVETEIKNLAKTGETINAAEGIIVKNFIDKSNLMYVEDSIYIKNIGDNDFVHSLDSPNIGLGDLHIDDKYNYDGNITLFRIGEGADNLFGGKLEPYSPVKNNHVLTRVNTYLIKPGFVTLSNSYKTSYYTKDLEVQIDDLTIYPCVDYNTTIKVNRYGNIRVFDSKYKNLDWNTVWKTKSNSLTTKVAPINHEYCFIVGDGNETDAKPSLKPTKIELHLFDNDTKNKILLEKNLVIPPYINSSSGTNSLFGMGDNDFGMSNTDFGFGTNNSSSGTNSYKCFTLDYDKQYNGKKIPLTSSSIQFMLYENIKGKVDYTMPIESDSFAIRPKKYTITTSDTKFKAGEKFAIDIKAIDDNENLTPEYTKYLRDVNFTIEVNETKAGCLTGEFNTTISKFENGQMADDQASYKEIGEVLLKIKEKDGGEFALIDKDEPDCDDACRLIEEANVTLNFTPDHFKLKTTLTNHNEAAKYTYLSNSLSDTKGVMNVLIQAQNLDNNITKNYSGACYAKDGTLDVGLKDLNSDVKIKLDKMMYYYITPSGTVKEGNLSVSSISSLDIDFLKDVFINGTADVNMSLNFNRRVDVPVRPFVFDVNSTNYSDVDSINSTEKENNGTINFYYGRVHSPNLAGESPTNANVFYEIYMLNSSDDIANIAGETSVDSFEWKINKQHDLGIDGVIFGYKALSDKVSTSNESNESVTLTYDGANLPYKDTINIYSSPWLIYNKYDSASSYSNFTVEFIGGQKNWSGVGEGVNTSIDSNASKRVTRKLEW